jgi:hypothetical protein
MALLFQINITYVKPHVRDEKMERGRYGERERQRCGDGERERWRDKEREIEKG